GGVTRPIFDPDGRALAVRPSLIAVDRPGYGGGEMQIVLVRSLQAQRDLYDLPRGMERFQAYIALMTGGRDEMLLPLSLLNPMGREHVAATLDALLAVDAEAAAEEAAAGARRRLAGVPGGPRGALRVADCRGGCPTA